MPNILLLGPRPYEPVPAFLQHADVVVIPHLVNPFTESLDPIKAYECLAAGRPTVATPVAGFRELGAAGRHGRPADFVGHRGGPASTIRPAPPPARADVPTWRQRAEAMASVMHRVRTDGPAMTAHRCPRTVAPARGRRRPRPTRGGCFWAPARPYPQCLSLSAESESR